MTDTPESFELEPPPTPGQVPERVIDELRAACRSAVDLAQAFGDACKAQADKYGIQPGALKRYVRALEGDKLAEVDQEAEDLLALINRRSAE